MKIYQRFRTGASLPDEVNEMWCWKNSVNPDQTAPE